MTNRLSCLSSFSAIKIYTAILSTTAVVSYLAHGVTDQTVLPLVRIFAKHCTMGALSNATVQSPIGQITCASLADVIRYEEVSSSVLTWVMPIIVSAASGLGTYVALKSGCCTNCSRLPRRYTKLHTNPQEVDDV